MNKQLIIEKTKGFVKEKLNGEGTGHDYFHIERVLHTSRYIANKEGGDLFVVSLAALLHDISDHKFNHGDSNIGGNIAKEWLIRCEVQEELINHVSLIVKTISFKGGTNTIKQETLEGRIVQDADRIDAMGAIGIARTFAYGGYKNREIYNPEIKPKIYENYEVYQKSNQHTINHFYEKLLLLKDLMNTDTGKEIALKRHQFMESYLKQFYEEWNGKEFD